MDVLFVAHRAPFPPDKGDRLRAFHLLRGLAALGPVDLVAPADSEEEAAAARAGLAGLCREVHVEARRRPAARLRMAAALVGGGSLTLAWMRDARLRRAVDELLARRRYDLCFGFSSGCAELWSRTEGRRRIFDLCDLDALKWEALARRGGGLREKVWGLEARRLLPIELGLAAGSQLVLLSTPREEADLRARGGRPAASAVLPHGTDGRRFDGLPPAGAAEPVIGFLGQMDYAPNVEAALVLARQVLPLVVSRCPQARLRILGRQPARAVAALHDPPRVEVTGAIDDVPAELGRLAVFAAPLESGRGLASKLLEALAAARPLVLSSWAAGSLSGEPGRTYLVADGPQATAEAVAGLLADPARRDALGRVGQDWVLRHHDWDALLARLQQLAREAAHA